MNTQIELFKFNPATDYLPFYKKFFIQITPNMNFLHLLEMIEGKESFGFENNESFCIKANNKFINLKTNVFDINFADVIRIEPISEYRAIKDLIIDTKDFEDKFEPFAKFDTDGELKHYYNNFILEYYASKTLQLKNDYIGEAGLMLAKKIILEMPEKSQEVLEIIANEENGIWFHTSLKDKILDASANEECFEFLFELLTGSKIESSKFTFCDINNVQDFSNFNIGFFGQGKIQNEIEKTKANFVSLELSSQDLAKHSKSQDFTLKIASEILLEALDKNCDFLVVEDHLDLEIFDKKQPKISSISGREINLPIISKQQFAMLCNGEKDAKKLGFDTHKIKINFL